jgi:hypothetical protein
MIPLVALKDDPAVIEAVLRALVHDSDDLVRQTAILVLSEMVHRDSR